MKAFFKVTMPMMSNGIISGALLSWIAIITELSSGVILYNYRTTTLTIEYTANALFALSIPFSFE